MKLRLEEKLDELGEIGDDVERKVREIEDNISDRIKNLKLKKKIISLYSTIRAISFRKRGKEILMKANNSYINSRNYVFNHVLKKVIPALRYVFLKNELPPEAELEIEKAKTDLKNAEEKHGRESRILKEEYRRKEEELKAFNRARESGLEDLFDYYLQQRDEKIAEKDSEIREMEGIIAGLQNAITTRDMHESYLSEQLTKAAEYCLSIEAESQGKQGKDLPYFHLIIKQDAKGDLSLRDLNRKAVSFFQGYSKAEFLRDNEEELKEVLKNTRKTPGMTREVAVRVKDIEQRFIIESIAPRNFRFLANLDGIPQYYKVYERGH